MISCRNTTSPLHRTLILKHARGRYEESLEEAYEGWGGQGTGANSGGSGGAGSEAPAQGTKRRKKVTNLRGLFPRPGVVYPIVPTGHMRLPRPRPRPSEKQSSGGGDGGGGLFNVITPSSTSWSFSSPYEDDLGNSGRTEQGQRVNFVVQARMLVRVHGMGHEAGWGGRTQSFPFLFFVWGVLSVVFQLIPLDPLLLFCVSRCPPRRVWGVWVPRRTR